MLHSLQDYCLKRMCYKAILCYNVVVNLISQPLLIVAPNCYASMVVLIINFGPYVLIRLRCVCITIEDLTFVAL